MGTINTAFVKQYSDMVMHLVQQTTSRLRGAVMVDADFTGEYKFYDQLGQTAMEAKTSRHQDTPVMDPDHQRRRVSGTDYIHAFLLDQEDELNMIIDPTSDYAKAAAMAAGRQIDQIVYAALVGTAYSGKDGGTSTTLASYNSSAHITTATSGLTVDSLLETKELLDLAGYSEMERRFYACTAREIKDLLNTTEVKSSDYNTVKALAQGDVNSFCGFEFIVLPDDSYTNGVITRSSGTDKCVAFTESALKLAIKRDITVRIDERPDKNYATQVWTALTAGAVRLEEEKVVQITVTNA